MTALRDRNFRLLFAARAVSYVGTYLAPIAVAFAVLDLGGSATDVGLSFAAWTLAQVATLAFGGVLGDRLPRRLVMVGSDTASFAVRTLMGVLLVSGHASVWELIVLQALGGAAVAFYSPASYGLVREVVATGQLQQANSLLGIARYAAFPLGAALGGSIVATIGSGTALLVDAGTYAASALLLASIHVVSHAQRGGGVLHELREGWSAFVEHTWVWLLTLWIALYFLITYAPFFVLGPYVAKHSMHGAGSWGIVVTGEGIGALAGAVAGLRVRLKRRPLFTVGMLFLPTALQSVLLAYHAPAGALAPAAALAGFGFAFGGIVYDSTLQRVIAPEKIARVGAYGWLGAMIFLPAGYALAGPIADAVGIRGYLLFGAAWLVVTTVAVVNHPSVRDFREEPVEAAPAAVPS
ncbi:MAG TPA: MFS transporter [Gaiellaceae bacterium]|nr:MFS transporter [Gaiellaceae bacterium]